MDDDNQDDLTRRLLTLLTDRLEAASVTAAKGQRSGLDAELATVLAQQLHSVGQDVTLLADVIIALVRRS
ncbi:MAG: hypothetical protein AB7G25_06995 [Sphingomonadaceae bacterium]